MEDSKDYVVCNSCGWTGKYSDLTTITALYQKEEVLIDTCRGCGELNFLMCNKEDI